MRRLSALAIIGLVVVGAAGASQTARHASGQRWRVTVYFLTDRQTAALGVRRTVVRRGTEPLARLALAELLSGPDAGDRRQGLTTAIPADAVVRSLSIVRRPTGSTATLDLAGLPALSTVRAARIARVGTQIARTLIGLSDITRVRIESGGRPWNFWLMSGAVSTRPWDYDVLVGLWVGGFKALP